MTDRHNYFYSYQEGLTGDFIPFYHDGVYHLFHIAWKDWGHATTKDFVTFEDHPVAILHGVNPEDKDFDVFTGSVIEKDGVFHAFYCGHCDANAPKGLPWETMLHATSTDLEHWEKDTDFELPIDSERYVFNGWRDGFVFYDEDKKVYKMLITTATKDKTYKRWGCIALAESKDLVKWVVKDPLYAPGIFDAHECPDMFKMGDKWYLVFSSFTRLWETKYRISDSPEGPWVTPEKDDLFDGRAFYAAKTLFDGKRRIIVGWTAIKGEKKDDVKYGWGGNLTAHEVYQKPDGTLAVRILPEIPDSFTKRKRVKRGEKTIGTGVVEEKGRKISISAPHSYCSVPLSVSGDNCYIHAKIKIKPGTISAGLIFRADYETYEKWCALRIEPGKGRIYFDRSNKFFSDHFYDEVRPITVKKNGVYDVKIVCYGSMAVMYINDETALSVRIYDFDRGQIGFFTEEGSAELMKMEVKETKLQGKK